MVLRISYILLVCFFSSTVFAKQAYDVNEEVIIRYIDRYKDVAIDEMVRAGIPASIKLAQAILESNAGRSYLAVNGNNHFGIKCGKYWQGRTVMREDDDYENGKLIKSCFRAFPSVAFSFKAHSEFLLDPKKDYRYGFLFELPITDYRAWAKGLKKAGYATDPNYPKRLISLIERFELSMYDQQGLEREAIGIPIEIPVAVHTPESTRQESSTSHDTKVESNLEKSQQEAVKPTKTEKSRDEFFAEETTRSYTISKTNDIEFVEAASGDNLTVIALETGIPLDDLVCYNDYGYAAEQAIPIDAPVYLAPKKNKYHGKRSTYRVNRGETAFDIAQKFGIRLKKLRARNHWDDHYQPKAGEMVYLRGKKKK